MMMASVRDVGARGRDGVYERVTKLASVFFFVRALRALYRRFRTVWREPKAV